jgi:hypothetical protein
MGESGRDVGVEVTTDVSEGGVGTSDETGGIVVAVDGDARLDAGAEATMDSGASSFASTVLP